MLINELANLAILRMNSMNIFELEKLFIFHGYPTEDTSKLIIGQEVEFYVTRNGNNALSMLNGRIVNVHVKNDTVFYDCTCSEEPDDELSSEDIFTDIKREFINAVAVKEKYFT